MLKLNRDCVITPQMFPKNADSPTSLVTLGISNNEEVKLNFIPKGLKTDSHHHKKCITLKIENKNLISL